MQKGRAQSKSALAVASPHHAGTPPLNVPPSREIVSGRKLRGMQAEAERVDWDQSFYMAAQLRGKLGLP